MSPRVGVLVALPAALLPAWSGGDTTADDSCSAGGGGGGGPWP